MGAENFTGLILEAIDFAADKHRYQRRKGSDASPYINHPIEVARLLWSIGGVRNPNILAAAILHDTLEDTDAAPAELSTRFGASVLALVRELTDDKTLPQAERKRLQVEHAPHLSFNARLIKIADKTSNVREVGETPPVDWSRQRRSDYLDWADEVIDRIRGTNEALERHYDDVMKEARAKLK